MKNNSEPLETLAEIRSMMERSSRFISLNGFSGVFAGSFALIGAYLAYWYLNISLDTPNNYSYLSTKVHDLSFISFFLLDAGLVLVLSLAVAIFLTVRKARKKGLKIWDNTSKRVLINMLIPLVTGGLFCIALLYHGQVGLIAPATLIFYGLALINTSKYTYDDIRYLGIIETIIGVLATFWIGYGLLFWALGFGIVHIIYGIIVYFKYER